MAQLSSPDGFNGLLTTLLSSIDDLLTSEPFSSDGLDGLFASPLSQIDWIDSTLRNPLQRMDWTGSSPHNSLQRMDSSLRNSLRPMDSSLCNSLRRMDSSLHNSLQWKNWTLLHCWMDSPQTGPLDAIGWTSEQELSTAQQPAALTTGAFCTELWYSYPFQSAGADEKGSQVTVVTTSTSTTTTTTTTVIKKQYKCMVPKCGKTNMNHINGTAHRNLCIKFLALFSHIYSSSFQCSVW